MAGRRPGLDHPGQNKKDRPQPHDWIIREKWPAALGRIVRGGSSRRSPHPPDWSVQGKVAARSEGDMKPRPRWCYDGVKTGCSAKDYAMEMQ